jgi:oxygen-independent coproporphyrinogen III oxidase
MSKEIELRKNELTERIDSIYFGGGTPSLLEKHEFELLLNSISSNYSVGDNIEITIEANPDDCSELKLQDWINLGINRLSIGLQSFKDGELEWMNRSHTTKQGISAVKNAQKAGFSNISIDLIYGLPELNKEEWLISLKNAIALNPSHISAYCLTVEPKTALHKWASIGRFNPLDEEIQNEQFEDLILFLEKHNYEQYEISNFAKNQSYAKHNTAYWEGKKYLGFGPSAHSYDRINRRWNISNNSIYCKNMGLNSLWYQLEELTQEDQWNELFLTGFRTKWGVNKKSIKLLGGLNDSEQKMLSKFISLGLLINTNTSWILTFEGKKQADGLASEMFRLNNN